MLKSFLNKLIEFCSGVNLYKHIRTQEKTLLKTTNFWKTKLALAANIGYKSIY